MIPKLKKYLKSLFHYCKLWIAVTLRPETSTVFNSKIEYFYGERVKHLSITFSRHSRINFEYIHNVNPAFYQRFLDNFRCDKTETLAWNRLKSWWLTLRKKYRYSELFWSVFSRIRTEYGEILLISLYLVQMRENTDHNDSEYGHLQRSVKSAIELERNNIGHVLIKYQLLIW